ncbi:MAG: DUF5916 domain-containing protein [Gemmatimonadota bacterium]|nr:DUF5916 domain-containing protein [Gemmatimonadota bacterium]
MMITVAAAAAALAGAGQQAAERPEKAPPGGADGPPTTAVYDGSAGQLDVPALRVAGAAIDIDGEIDEAVWADAPVLTGFTQFDPVEGVPATQRTEARVLLTDDAIYFAVTAWDDVQDGIRATLGDRDSFGFSDDFVRFVLDTFDDSRRGYVIMVNPLGVQQDGLWVVGGGQRRRWGPPIDWNPDFVWDSGGRIFDGGYSVEVRVPLKSIRFPSVPVQDWGLQIERRIARNGYRESWAPVTADVANQMEQFGTLTGLRDLSPGLFLEINPVQTFSRQGAYDSDAGAFRREGIDGDFGFNVTYGITSNLTLDGTYNPDFSQVEADAGQIAVNERFALFLREKRPFFLEGTEIFQLPRQLVYTRSIVNPVVGAKLQGKIGSFNAGYLGALDEVGDSDDPDGKENAVVNLLRLRRDLGSTSNIGMVYTDRASGQDRFNRVLGVDGRFQLKQRYTVTLLAAGSRTSQGDPGAVSGGLLGAQVERSGRNFRFELGGSDISNDFVAGSGFIRRTGVAQVGADASYNFRGRPGDLIESWGPRLEAEGLWTHDDFRARRRPQESGFELGGSVSLRGNITVFGNYSRSYYRFGADAYDGLFFTDADGLRHVFRPGRSLFQGLGSGTIFFWVNTFDRVRGNVRLTRSESPLFDFITDTPVDIADSWSGNASLNLFPTTSLSAELGVRHTSLFRKRDGSLYSRATIPRARAQYQFNRALYIRTILEYGSQSRGALLTPEDGRQVSYCSAGSCVELEGTESNDFSVEALLGYEPTPGTVFFLGYTRRMEDTEAFRFREVRPEAEGVFVKLSYRFRG